MDGATNPLNVHHSNTKMFMQDYRQCEKCPPHKYMSFKMSNVNTWKTNYLKSSPS